MKQARKILIFFVFLALAIYYVPLFLKKMPTLITQFLKSSQMANFVILINQKAETTFFPKK